MQRIAVSNQAENLILLFDCLDKSIPSQHSIIQQLRANHEMQMASKVIQATEIFNLKKKIAHKKSWSTKTIHNNCWDSNVCQAVEKQKALNNEAEKEWATEKTQKKQKKVDRRIADEIRKALNKAAKEAKAIEIQWKKKEATLEKIRKAGERAEKKAQSGKPRREQRKRYKKKQIKL